MENKKASDRVISIWDDLSKTVHFWEKLVKSKRPNSNSYSNLKSAVFDDLMLAKLQFFSYVASKVEPYLKVYQTDNPMIPFMYFDLRAMFKGLLEMIVVPEVLDKCKTGKQLVEIDLGKKENLLKLNKIDLGFGVDSTLKKLRLTDKVSKSAIFNFKEKCQELVIVMLKKLNDKTPLTSEFLRACSVFLPQFLGGRPRESVLAKWKLLLSQFLELNILSSKDCDEATSEFKSFYDKEVVKFKDTLLEFSKEERLDELYFDTLGISKYKIVSSVVALILTLSHGQASVERGFSQNNNLVKTNMSPETIISKRIIKDHMLANDLKQYTIKIDAPMVKAFRSARAKYIEFLKLQKEKRANTEKETRADHMTADIESLSSKCKTLERTIQMLDTEIVQCIKTAEEKDDMTLVKKGNALKRKSENTKSELDILNGQIKDLKEKRRKILQ